MLLTPIAAFAAVLVQDGTAPASPSPAHATEAALAALVSEDRAQETVGALVAFGPRMGGTSSGDRAADWLAEQFRVAKLPVEIVQDKETWCHEERSWSVSAIVAATDGEPAQSFELASAWPYGFSPSAAGRARLSLADEAGSAVLVSRRRRAPADAAPAIVLVDGQTTEGGEYPQVLHLSAGDSNPCPVFGLSAPDGKRLRELARAQRVVEIEFKLDAVIRRAKPRTVVARLPAREGAPPGFLLYCAHGDSDAGGPGANDNGSGEAIVLEIAAAWAKGIADGLAPPPAREIRFAIWGKEIHSTRDFLGDRIPAGEPLLGVINYDQSGFGSSADVLAIEPDDVPANRELVLTILSVLKDFAGAPGFPERWMTNKSLGGTDSYVFSRSKLFREDGRPSVTLYASAWDRPEAHPRTDGMPGESWNDSDEVHVDYDVYYHSAGDLPENTTAREPWNMGWGARVGLLAGRRWLEERGR